MRLGLFDGPWKARRLRRWRNGAIAPPDNAFRRWARWLAQPVTYLGVAMLAFVFCALAYLVIQARQEADYLAQRRGVNLAHILDESLSHFFRSVDAVLLFMRESYRNGAGHIDVVARSEDPLVKLGMKTYFTHVGPDGVVLGTGLTQKAVGFNVSDREFFFVHKNGGPDEMYISAPMLLRTAGKWAILMSRRLNAPDGSFAGVIAGVVEPGELARTFDSVDLGRNGSISLIGLDGYVRARVTEGKLQQQDFGRQFPSTAGVLGRARQADAGQYWNAPSMVDSVNRMVTYRVLPSLPLVVLVGVSEAEVYRYANERIRFYGLIAGLLTVGILFAIWLGALRERKLVETSEKMKEAQDALLRSQERYALVENTTSDGIWDWNMLSGDVYVSPRWRTMMGYPEARETHTHVEWFEWLHPDDRDTVREVLRGHLDEGKPYVVDFRMRGIDGVYRWMHANGKVLRDDAGRPVRMVGTLTDVTAHRKAEAILARANQELEQRVAERTEALGREMRQREEAQRKIAQIERLDAVGQLTAGIAHDFHNLLAVIGGSLEFVARAADKGLPAEPELLDASLRATRRGRELVQRLLTFARQSPLKAEPTNVDRLVLDTLRLLQRTLGEEIEIETQLRASHAVVSVDRGQLGNALLNLALNARDAMPGGGRLCISTLSRKPAAADSHERRPAGEEVCIVISDTGTGMSKEVRGRAFEPFFTTKPEGLGSGLGLSMVHGFVKHSGGYISIDSEAGQGTTLTIHLPRTGDAAPDSVLSPADIPPAVRKEKTVLLVEDDLDVRIVTSAQLKHLGYNVHAVANGLEAMDLLSSPAEIDITLTDLVLPAGIDGVMLVEEAMRARPTMGVLCMTGYDPTRRHRKWLEMQNIELLEKPFSSAKLERALENALAA